MVNYKRSQLGSVLAALSDDTRRSMVERLRAQSLPLSRLRAPYKISAPAISKHLRVLEDAGLIERAKKGREVVVSLQTEPLQATKEWFTNYEEGWAGSFANLENTR